ncbi:Multidrug export protein MepA [compost metagenome]
MERKSYQMDMSDGPLTRKMLFFSIPLMLSGILQLVFNAINTIVVGKYVGSEALAAVGSTSSLIFLLTSLFLGLSVGSTVLTANFFGSKNERDISETVHTSMAMGLVCGIGLMFVGILGARPLLTLMGTPTDILDLAVLYMRVYFIGMPAILTYNLGSAVLRAVGDTRRPLYYLLLSGVINVLLNLLFVIALHMSVAGSALATACSQTLSALLVGLLLKKSEGPLQLQIRKIRISRQKLLGMLRIGLPAGVQGILFSLSNVLIQSSINSFGSVAIAGSTAAANIEGFVTTSMNAFHQTTVSFTGQNYGARNYRRILRILLLALGFNVIVGLTLGSGAYLFSHPLLGIYQSNDQAISFGAERMLYTCIPYFLLGLADVFVGLMRGLGYSMVPMMVSLVGICGLRIVWLFTIFPLQPTWAILFISYPITWALTALAQFVCSIAILRRVKRQMTAAKQ